MKTGLEEEIKTLEEEKSVFSRARGRGKQLKEDEVKALKDKIPQKFLQELNGGASTLLSKGGVEEKESNEGCANCEEEDFL